MGNSFEARGLFANGATSEEGLRGSVTSGMMIRRTACALID